MFLNQTYQYALRAMTTLSILYKDTPVSSKELSDKSGIPSHYLSKIMRKLVESGFIESQKGHGGGFTILVDVRQLRIIDVLKAVGFDLEAQPCVFGWKKCSSEDPCPMHPVWKKLKMSFNDWACNTNFKEIKKAANELEYLKWSLSESTDYLPYNKNKSVT